MGARSFLEAYFQCVRGNQPVEANFAGQTVELVAVGVGGAIDLYVMFGYLFLFSFVVVGIEIESLFNLFRSDLYISYIYIYMS